MKLIESIENEAGLYSVHEASIYARVSFRTLSRWLFGTKSRKPLRKPMIEPEVGSGKFLTFVEFVEALAIGELRKNGISLQKIREALNTATKTYHIEHPFADERHKVYRIGGDLYIELDADKQPTGLTGRDRYHKSFRQVLEVYMQGLSFGPDHLAISYTPYVYKNNVVRMNPAKLFGEPILEKSGYPARTLWEAAQKEGSIAAAAKSYEVDETEVETACLYWYSLQDAA
jgi:uncharacterized protein (DUF433 family)